jgi:hypothetical protein
MVFLDARCGKTYQRLIPVFSASFLNHLAVIRLLTAGTIFRRFSLRRIWPRISRKIIARKRQLNSRAADTIVRTTRSSLQQLAQFARQLSTVLFMNMLSLSVSNPKQGEGHAGHKSRFTPSLDSAAHSVSPIRKMM